MGRLLIKNGTLIDKSENILFSKKDILIDGEKIMCIADKINAEVEETIDCTGLFVSAGFIDIHTHVFPGAPGLGIAPDPIGVEQGVTTVIDAGTAGPENFDRFVEEVVKTSKTRVLSEMNYSKKGLWVKPEGDDESKWDIELAEHVYRQHSDIIVAIKARASNTCVGSLGIKPIKVAKELASRCGIPLYVHIGHALPLIEDTLAVMQKGDMLTHCFHGKDNNLQENGIMKKETINAKERGVKFDVGHGVASFNFNLMKSALAQNFYPDCISTDLHLKSWKHPVNSLSETMDKLIALGLSLEDAICDVTSNPAEILNLKGLGKLKEGNIADITIFHVDFGEANYLDSDGNELIGHSTIKPDIAIVGGKVMAKNISGVTR